MFLLSARLLSCSEAQPPSKTGNISPAAFQKLLQEKTDALLLDVRTADEYAGGHLARARNIDFYAADFAAQIGQLDKSKPVLVYCAVGGRSGKTMEMMKKAGFKEVYNLDGGFNAWKAGGLPTEQ